MRLSMVLGLVMLGVALLVGTGTSGGTKKGKGSLPANWKKLDLSKDQEVKIRAIAADYQVKIHALQKQLDDLKVQQRKDQFKVLSENQKEKLRQILLGETPEKEKKSTSKDKDK